MIITNAVKASSDMTLMVLGGPYGVDRYGQEFTAETDFGDLPVVPAIYHHGWGPDGGERIGWAYKAERDSEGQWYRVVLDATKAIARKIYKDAQQGLARASSDALGHLVEPPQALKSTWSGKVMKWWIGAMSLMDEAVAATAVNPRAIAIPAVRAMLNELAQEQGVALDAAVKAGAKYSKATQDKMRTTYDALKAGLAELETMIGEFTPQPEGPDTTLTDNVLTGHAPEQVQLAVKGDTQVDEKVKDETVVEASAETEAPANGAEDELVNAAVESAVKAQTETPPTTVQAVKTYTEEQVKRMLKAASDRAANGAFKATQRPGFAAPAVIQSERRAPTPRPLYWAVKAALQSGGKIVFNMPVDSDDELRFDGTQAAVKAFKAMSGIVSSNVGEQFIPRVQTNIVLEALYSSVVARQLPGVMIYPMPGRVADAPTIGSFTAAWGAENAAAASAGDATTGKLTLSAKILKSMGKVSNELLVDSNPGIESYIRKGLAQAMMIVHDLGFFKGTGTGDEPTGIMTGVTGVAATGNLMDDIIDAIGRMAAADLPVSPSNTSIVMRPELVTKSLKQRVGGSGDYIVSATSQNGSIVGSSWSERLSQRIGYPVFQTTVIPNESGNSDVAVVYGPEIIIGDLQELEIVASNTASDAFEKNQTHIRCMWRGDFLKMRSSNVEVINNVPHV